MYISSDSDNIFKCRFLFSYYEHPTDVFFSSREFRMQWSKWPSCKYTHGVNTAANFAAALDVLLWYSYCVLRWHFSRVGPRMPFVSYHLMFRCGSHQMPAIGMIVLLSHVGGFRYYCALPIVFCGNTCSKFLKSVYDVTSFWVERELQS
jgi:hypothetical protein